MRTKEVRKEHESQGFDGRFGPSLPRVFDGPFLLLLHLLSKMRMAQDGGSRFGIQPYLAALSPPQWRLGIAKAHPMSGGPSVFSRLTARPPSI